MNAIYWKESAIRGPIPKPAPTAEGLKDDLLSVRKLIS